MTSPPVVLNGNAGRKTDDVSDVVRTKPTHADLVRVAERWLRRKHPVVLADVQSAMTNEQPDAIGWMNNGTSTLIECKASRSELAGSRLRSDGQRDGVTFGYNPLRRAVQEGPSDPWWAHADGCEGTGQSAEMALLELRATSAARRGPGSDRSDGGLARRLQVRSQSRGAWGVTGIHQTVNRGIPTLYKDTLFRSRLEARWAAMFDALKWPWEYEFADLAWYVPDFALLFGKPIAIEIKPELEIGALAKHARKIVTSGWEGEALALGARLFEGDVIGSFLEKDGPEHVVGPARAFQCINCGSVSIHNADHGWACRVRGCYAGNAHVGGLDDGFLARAWAEAGNRVQWKGSGH